MEEIEVKILEIDKKNIEDTLVKLRAKKIFDGKIETAFYDFKDGSIAKARNVLRVRKEQDRTELTYKKVNYTKTAKVAEEITVEISDMQEMKEILHNLGLLEIEDTQKIRTSYKLDSLRFDIDHYLGAYSFIPDFLEIEAPNIKLIHRSAKELGFQEKDCLAWSTPQLIQHYSSKKLDK